jgi:hypothetical protein
VLGLYFLAVTSSGVKSVSKVMDTVLVEPGTTSRQKSTRPKG